MTLRPTVSSKHSSGVDEKCSDNGDRKEAGMPPRWNSIAFWSLSHGELTPLTAHRYIPKHESFLLSPTDALPFRGYVVRGSKYSHGSTTQTDTMAYCTQPRKA